MLGHGCFLKFLRERGITHALYLQVENMDTHTVLDGDFAKVGERASPAAELAQHVGKRFRNKDVPGVTTIHNALGHVNAVTSDVFLSSDVRGAVDGTGVHANAHGEFRQKR